MWLFFLICVWGRSDVKKIFTSWSDLIPSGFMQLTIASVTKAHCGQLLDVSRYFLSHVISIAVFLASRSRSSIPPSLISLCSLFILIGGDFFRSQMKSLVILLRVSHTGFGMPCVLVRNCVMAPTVSCIISCLASRVGLCLFQSSRDCLILSIIGFQGCVWLVLLPIHAPRHLMVLLSFAILISSWSLWSSGWSFLVVVTLSRCSCVPIGMISVFSMLNLVPDALHHRERISCSVSYLLDSDRYIVALSA